jgi:RNA polymerase sigma-70 factor, ECF subfamily
MPGKGTQRRPGQCRAATGLRRRPRRAASDWKVRASADRYAERGALDKGWPMADAAREERFTRLVQEHGDAVARYLRRRHTGLDATATEDLLADVMAVAWRRLDKVPPDAEAPWLFGVARNRLANARRRSMRRESVHATMRPPASAPSAEDVAVADLVLSDALARLSDKEREAVTLTAWEGLDPQQLAVALGVSVNAAAVRLSKAKSRLRSMLSEVAESPEAVATGTPQ